jgi:hypothetical protein
MIKATFIALVLSVVLFSCYSNTAQTTSVPKADTTRPVITKQRKDTAKAIQRDTIVATQWDSVKEEDVTVDNYKIMFEADSTMPAIRKKVDSISFYEGEGDCQYKIWHIKKSDIRFCWKTFIDLDMFDNSMSLFIKGERIKIGDNEDILKDIFPLSFKNKYRMYIPDSDKIAMPVLFIGNTEQELDFVMNDAHKIISIDIYNDPDKD